MTNLRIAVLALLLAIFGLGACSPAPPETLVESSLTSLPAEPANATEPETETAEALAPLGEAALYVAKEPVSLREGMGDEPMELFGGETVSPTVGAEVLVGEGGVGLLRWAGFLKGELMSDAAVTIRQIDADNRSIALIQQPGTARYTLPKEAGEAVVGVSAGPVGVDLRSVPGDVIVSHQPAGDGDPIVWVVVMNGEATLTVVDADVVIVPKGHVVAYVPGEGFTAVMSVEPVSVEIWYGALTAGRVKPITIATFRCEVVAEAADAVPEPMANGATPLAVLKKGNVVDGLGRDEMGTWVQVAGYGITGTAWVPADALRCIFPVGQMVVSEVLLAQTEASATPVLGATSVAAAGATGTPTTMPTRVAANEVRDQGSGGGGTGSSSSGSSPTEASTEAKPVGLPTETECVGTECVAPAPPTETPRPPRRTKEPTQPPPPTSPPPTEPPPPPTDPPAPDPTSPPPQPTAPSAPTDMPPPEPTEGT